MIDSRVLREEKFDRRETTEGASQSKPEVASVSAIPIAKEIISKPVYRVIKRGLDLGFSALMLLILAPLFLVVYILVVTTSKGPALYMSRRVGRCGKTFLFPKFRTMYVDAEQRRAELEKLNEKDGPIFKMKHDPRVTPVGRFLRKYSLDELPQLLCVVKGEMSLVGPRPPIPSEVSQYDEAAQRRLSVKPGITCYWQIMGRSDLSFEEMVALDNRYIDEMSFTTDVKILIKTPKAVLSGKGAY